MPNAIRPVRRFGREFETSHSAKRHVDLKQNPFKKSRSEWIARSQEAASVDVSRAIEQEAAAHYDPSTQAPISVARVTDDLQEILAILSGIGFAAGMPDEDRAQLLAAASRELSL